MQRNPEADTAAIENQERTQIERILSDFRGIREISNITRPQKRICICSISTEDGNKATSKASIAEVFATFYEKLYSSCWTEASRSSQSQLPIGAAPPFTMEDLQAGLCKLKHGKAGDAAGIVAEMVKKGGEALHASVLELFNDVLDPQAAPPETCKRTRLSVIFKTGDPKEAKNYGPIASISILYKLFSRMLCTRIQATVFESLSNDQAAYRPGYSTEDHLLTIALLTEPCEEWNQDLWLGLVDFEKAFDTVEHQSLFEVLTKSVSKRVISTCSGDCIHNRKPPYKSV